MHIAVLDYGSGNIRSAQRALETTGAQVSVTSDFNECLDADGLLVPGVGAFAACVAGIKSVRGDQLIERRLAGGRSVMGICVGMQVLFDSSSEHGSHEGFGQWPGTVSLLDAPVLPHMGWNTVRAPELSKMFAGISSQRFYFVHSYAARTWELFPEAPMPSPLVTFADHGSQFVAAVENGPLWATQFHPEKSGEPGLRLLRNWVESIEASK